MAALRRHRRLLIALTGIGFLVIVVLAPSYGELQWAADADRFREILPDDQRGRYLAATVVDFFFAAAYAATALALSDPDRRLSVAGAWAFVVGAVFDIAENSVVLANVLDAGAVTDGRVDAMRMLGYGKWAGAAVGLVLMAVSLVQRRRTP